jgi:4'-phosphopantetheinyl transferase
MPLKEIQVHEGKLALWHILETGNELERLLSARGRPDLIPDPLFRSEKRNLEWMAARLVMLSMAGQEGNIIYDLKGKPHLSGDKGFISISHSLPYAGIYHHPSLHVGVDLEVLNPKIHRIRSKFVNSSEDTWISKTDDLKALYLVWAAKEAVFKMIGGGGILFSEHLEVLPVKISEQGKVNIIWKNEIEILADYRFLDDMILVYTIAPPGL